MKNKKKAGLIILVGILIFLAVFFYYLYDYQRILEKIANENTDNIVIEENIVKLDSMTLRQKLSQMIIVRGDKKGNFNNLNIGGIFLDRQKSEEDYKELIQEYQDEARIKLFVSTDLEGAWTPFHEQKEHQIFPYFSEIGSREEAYDVGKAHGELLKEVGFNLNFAPVAEFSDKAYGGRVFLGTKEEIKEKLEGYIEGLQENVMGTCKHYPGKTLHKNLHLISDNQKISKEDLELFDWCIENDVAAIMVSHPIVTGEVDSNGKPSTVSKEVIDTLEFEGFVIADEINMRGLKNFYPDKTKLYVDLINAGEEVILDFYLDPRDVYKLVLELEREVKNGKISEDKIDESVSKILKYKGYEVK